MLSNRYYPLGGEGCPAPDVAKPAIFRKSCNVYLACSCRFVRERVGNVQKNWHTADTTAFTRRSLTIALGSAVFLITNSDRGWCAASCAACPRRDRQHMGRPGFATSAGSNSHMQV